MDIYEQLERNKGSLKYIEEVMQAGGGLEAWEVKEYSIMRENTVKRIEELQEEIAFYEILFGAK